MNQNSKNSIKCTGKTSASRIHSDYGNTNQRWWFAQFVNGTTYMVLSEVGTQRVSLVIVVTIEDCRLDYLKQKDLMPAYRSQPPSSSPSPDVSPLPFLLTFTYHLIQIPWEVLNFSAQIKTLYRAAGLSYHEETSTSRWYFSWSGDHKNLSSNYSVLIAPKQLHISQHGYALIILHGQRISYHFIGYYFDFCSIST